MFFFITVLCSLVLGLAEPRNDKPNWPWYNQGGQGQSPPYYDSGFNQGTGRGFATDRHWGTDSSDSGLSWGSLSDTNWGSRICGGAIRRARCAPSVNDIEQKLLGAAKKMEGFCAAYSDRPLRESYGVEHFKLRVRLAEFTSDNIEVRVRQRLVTILARTCTAEYSAVRVLPDIVEARHGKWRMQAGGRLTVMFPYTITPDTEIQSRCGREFDPDPIIVPRVADGTEFPEDYDLTFSDARLRRAIKRYLAEMLDDDDTQYVD